MRPIITARSELWKVLLWHRQSVFFFVGVWNISGTAVQIWAKFTRKMCLVPRLDEFEDQDERSNVKVTRENDIFRPFRLHACGICLVKHL